jgi:hypothetical protein
MGSPENGGTDLRLARARLTRTSSRDYASYREESATMPEQFENPEETKLENDTVSNESPEKAVERIAENAAQKSSLREKKYDEEHKIFSI